MWWRKHSGSAGVHQHRDHHVLLHIERPRIQRELQSRPSEEHARRQRPRHEVPQRHHRDLRRDRRYRQRLPPVPEKLVHERQHDARHHAQKPHPERVNRDARVVGFRHRRVNLVDGAPVVGILRRRRHFL